MPLDKKAITEELEQLQLEETRDRVEATRAHRAAVAARATRRNQDILDNRKMTEAQQANCWHKKGGKGVANLAHGNDHNYAVVKHTLSHGPMIVVCQRCSKVWEPPDTRLNARKASPEDKALYKKLWDEYQWAVNLPTDNEPSGTQLFVISKNEEPAA
jgi:hypothetical protein